MAVSCVVPGSLGPRWRGSGTGGGHIRPQISQAVTAAAPNTYNWTHNDATLWLPVDECVIENVIRLWSVLNCVYGVRAASVGCVGTSCGGWVPQAWQQAVREASSVRLPAITK